MIAPIGRANRTRETVTGMSETLVMEIAILGEMPLKTNCSAVFIRFTLAREREDDRIVKFI
jgi:hypothetical protein